MRVKNVGGGSGCRRCFAHFLWPAAARGIRGQRRRLGRRLPHGRDPVDEIVALAEDTTVQLVVIGLRRRNPVGKLLTGSTAQQILHDVNCPVLAVKAAR